MSDPVKQDRTAASIAMLPNKFRVLPGWQKLMNAITPRFNELERVFTDILTKRTLALATGVALDGIGDIVGRTRQGMDDPTYRLWLSAQILLLVSSGAIPDIIGLFLAVNAGTSLTFTVEEYFPRTFLVRASGPLNLPIQQGALLQKAKAATINAQLIAPPVQTIALSFTWGDSNLNGGVPVATSTKGWGDSSAPGTGGYWVSSY